ncbi:DUF4386 family protein [Corynebacterium guangdongense]|uniref:DUF4386 domain-containing protein n=1 Tax=Corynebacterium guangdongense TaxID=1783348 RepID=A0ABU1ZZ80_9CORY|nr:DUF4386 family protein [Corynebacterium guangdongense]MDR7330248.1 hypothetical protein [Corynebacterium guangdongense]WJZ18806.1 hypothetical protein CGUA_11345 [Corynebacterium guangdongense]
MTTARATALTAGAGLALMAVLAPLAVFLALPAGHTTAAGLLLAVVVLLDVVVAVTLSDVLSPGGGPLAVAAAGLRLLYATVFTVAVGFLLRGEVDTFERIWEPSLGVFGLHLLAVGVLGWRTVVPRLIAALVFLAGAGYLVDALLPLGVEVSGVSFVGEVALLLWLLARGGRARR